jgi:hypothetical protein
MIAIQRVGSMLLISFLLAACGSADEPRPPPPPVEETVFRDVVATPMEKANNVQNVVDERKRAVDAAVQRNENDE